METEAQQRNVLLLATEQKVYGFDLVETFRVAIGRHASNDLCFDSRNVSNYHAEILNEATGLVLRDLGSTNGTFVNGERVRQRKLEHGDQLRIGNNEVRVRLTNSDDAAKDVAPEENLIGRRGEFGKAQSSGSMTLKGLLLELCKSGKSMRLVLSRGQSDEIRVYIYEGRIVYAELGKARAEKALYRGFEWRKGQYRIEPYPANDSVPRTMGIPVETLIEEGETQADELQSMLSRIPPPEMRLRLREGSKMRICDFSAAEIEIFKAIIRHGTLAEMIDESSMTDLTVMSVLHALLQKKVFEVEEGSSLLEQTNVITRH